MTDDIEHMSSSYIRGDDDYTPLPPPRTHKDTKQPAKLVARERPSLERRIVFSLGSARCR